MSKLKDLPELKIVPLEKNARLPYKPLETSAFYDIPYSGKNFTIYPFEIAVVELPFSLIIPKGYYVQIVSRSGLSKTGLIVMNAPAVVDYGYTGKIKIILGNMSATNKYVEDKDRVAQFTLVKLESFQLVVSEIEELKKMEEDSSNDRKGKGLGSSDYSEVLNM